MTNPLQGIEVATLGSESQRGFEEAAADLLNFEVGC